MRGELVQSKQYTGKDDQQMLQLYAQQRWHVVQVNHDLHNIITHINITICTKTSIEYHKGKSRKAYMKWVRTPLLCS